MKQHKWHKEIKAWADEIVVMDSDHFKFVMDIQHQLANDEDTHMFEFNYRPVHVLNIEDEYDYRNPKLVKIMTDKFWDIFKDDLKVPTL